MQGWIAWREYGAECFQDLVCVSDIGMIPDVLYRCLLILIVIVLDTS